MIGISARKPRYSSWILLGVFAYLSLVSCAVGYRNPADPDNNSVEYQFIDADTMKPIQGAYVNVVWVTPTPPGKVNGSQCVQAALLRSDINGWVKMDGPKGSLLEVPWILVPDYEYLALTYRLEPKVESIHILSVFRADFERYPAWGDSLKQLGYTLINQPKASNVEFQKNFDHVPKSNDPRSFTGSQQYYVTHRSYPGVAYIYNVANSCGPEGNNIGLSDTERAETGTRRALHHLKLVCDKRWDTATGKFPQSAMHQALWLVETPMENAKAWERIKEVIPTYQGTISDPASPNMTKAERMAFCTWMQPFADKYK